MIIKGKKGASQALNLLITATILILILLVLVKGVLPKIPSMVHAATDCKSQTGAACMEATYGCPMNYIHQIAYDDSCGKGSVCCVPEDDVYASQLALRFNTLQRQALVDPITVTIDNDPNKVTSLDFREGEEHTIHIKFNDKLPEKAFGKVAVFFTNAQDPGKIYWLDNDKITEKTSYQELVAKTPVTYVDKTGYSSPDKKLKTTLKDSYQDYTLNIIVLDEEKIGCQQTVGTQNEEKWIECLTHQGQNGETNKATATPSYDSETLLKIYFTDPEYYLAVKKYPLDVKRILDITGVGTTWASEDTVTIVSSDPEYSANVGVTILDAYTANSLNKVVDDCAEIPHNSPNFKSQIDNVIGTTIETSGVPLNINLGGFRIPTSKDSLKYITEKKPLIMSNGKADVKFDRAAYAQTFYKEGGVKAETLAGQSAYVCAKVERVNKEGTHLGTAYAVSPLPLRVDVIPPYIDEETIQIKYPEAVMNTPNSSYNSQYPSIYGQPYFYRDYPKVQIPCYDSQSGCSNYDYYIKTGNFINFQVATNSTTGAIGVAALQVGLNMFMQYLASKTADSTICPNILSNEYRTNSRPEIRFRDSGQGIICIRAVDKAGNAMLAWKEMISTEEMAKRVALEAVQAAEQSALEGISGTLSGN